MLHWTICRKYMIKRLIHYLFHIIPAIIPRLISTFHCVSGWYGGLWMLPGLIWKRSCINLYVFTHTSVQDKFHIKWCLYRVIVTPRVIRVEQKLLTLPEHLSSPAVFSGVRVTRSLVLCLFCVDRCLSFCPFSFGHFVLLQILITSLVSSNSSRQCWSFLIWHIRVNMAHKTSLNLSLFIEVPVPSQKSERSCYWVSVVSILLLSTIFLLELFRQCGICFCFFIFFVLNIPRYLVLR